MNHTEISRYLPALFSIESPHAQSLILDGFKFVDREPTMGDLVRIMARLKTGKLDEYDQLLADEGFEYLDQVSAMIQIPNSCRLASSAIAVLLSLPLHRLRGVKMVNLQNYTAKEVPVDEFIWLTLKSINVKPKDLLQPLVSRLSELGIDLGVNDPINFIKSSITLLRNPTSNFCNLFSTDTQLIILVRGQGSTYFLSDLFAENRHTLSMFAWALYLYRYREWFKAKTTVAVDDFDLIIENNAWAAFDNELMAHGFDFNMSPDVLFAAPIALLAKNYHREKLVSLYPEHFIDVVPTNLLPSGARQLFTSADLVSEGKAMSHCLGGGNYEYTMKSCESIYFHIEIPGSHTGGTLRMTKATSATQGYLIRGLSGCMMWKVETFLGYKNEGVRHTKPGQRALDNFLKKCFVDAETLSKDKLLAVTNKWNEILKTPKAMDHRVNTVHEPRHLLDHMAMWAVPDLEQLVRRTTSKFSMVTMVKRSKTNTPIDTLPNQRTTREHPPHQYTMPAENPMGAMLEFNAHLEGWNVDRIVDLPAMWDGVTWNDAVLPIPDLENVNVIEERRDINEVCETMVQFTGDGRVVGAEALALVRNTMDRVVPDDRRPEPTIAERMHIRFLQRQAALTTKRN